MLVLDDRHGRAGRLQAGLVDRLERLGVYRPERRPWLPHLTVARFREGPVSAPPRRRSGRSVRPMRLSIIPFCGRTGRSTTFSKRLS